MCLRTQRAEVRTPALAKLPETSRPEEAFALARVVSGQDSNNCVLVALDPLSSALVGPCWLVAQLAGFARWRQGLGRMGTDEEG